MRITHQAVEGIQIVMIVLVLLHQIKVVSGVLTLESVFLILMMTLVQMMMRRTPVAPLIT